VAIYENNTCIVHDNKCYIEGICYEANETYRNSNITCLQCRPDEDQKRWILKKDCVVADTLCLNPLLLGPNICNTTIIQHFYADPTDAVSKHYNFKECGQDRKQCQVGFFFNRNTAQPLACCPGYFCPEGQPCMIPCRNGSYCPSELKAINGICENPVSRCPEHAISDYGFYGCGGSAAESYCPAESYCSKAGEKKPCPNGTHYCPTGVLEALPCPSGFVCLEGRARRTRLITTILLVVIILVLAYAVCAEISQWLILQKKLLGQHALTDPPGVSDYFRERKGTGKSKQQIQLHIHLNRAQLRNVTRFNYELNEGFTGRIASGKITALMGGSGCGKSSLLETIHGRRRLRSDGYITFGEHQPLSNKLTDYVGYVPQADIMHNDLTVFETVYYSARTRRLGEPKTVIINDVCFVLQRLGLKTMHNSMTKTLSGGKTNQYA
jgi:hypothetical protein